MMDRNGPKGEEIGTRIRMRMRDVSFIVHIES